MSLRFLFYQMLSKYSNEKKNTSNILNLDTSNTLNPLLNTVNTLFDAATQISRKTLCT